MSKLVRHLLEDVRAGLQTDADGRRYFRPRRVRFRTIDIAAAELFQAGWLNYETPLIPPYRVGNPNPSHREIREFATHASERFQEFWYRVFDVAVARALAGREVDVFQQRPFLEPNTFFDIGIPDDQTLSSIPPLLHEKIHAEYIRSRENSTSRRIYYLSNYLTNITGDLIDALEPYRTFWELKATRRRRLDQINEIHRDLTTALLPPPVHDLLKTEVDLRLLAHFDTLVVERAERTISDAALRALIHRRRTGDLSRLTTNERTIIFAAPNQETRIPFMIRAIAESIDLPAQSLTIARSAAGYSSAAYRLDLRRARLNYMMRERAKTPRDPATTRSLAERRARYLKLFLERLKSVPAFQQQGRPVSQATVLLRLASLRELGRRLALRAENKTLTVDCTNLLETWGTPQAPVSPECEIAAQIDLKTLLGVTRVLSELRQAEAQIAAYYESYEKDSPSSAIGEAVETNATDAVDGPPLPVAADEPTMYAGPTGTLQLEAGLKIGNPYNETQILKTARQLVFQRLRPVRRTANHYSMNPGHRHGAVTLNPVMKLWKERPDLTREGPELIRLEMNTRGAVQCLLELVELVDPDLKIREVRREKILRESRGGENLANLLVLLLPGSCYSLREVHRLDFPEFRGRVIGETRNPTELGVDPREDSLLTGGWYQKLNHTLYYPVGGDHGRLLRLIWNSARAPGPPAFLFALGQFVYDCLEDHLVYFRTTEKTFRECIEDYYLQEDRIRKNRGERMGRRRPDNSRAGVRFMFAILYSRLTMEALTGSSQSHFRHPPTETWMMRHLNLPVLNRTDRSRFIQIREAARSRIEKLSAENR